jgi:hypothetical protein
MKGRLFSAVSLAGMSFGLTMYTVLSANALEGNPNAVRAEGVRLSWDIAAGRSSTRVASGHGRFCVPLVARRGVGEGRSAPRMALVLGVAF